ncbi:hypothetical protein GCM10009681_07570 [Luedemannella helvata]|uniref:Iminophenyl-pyruvate dimer synthase domain-containing protein n=2 Tax=Luedemannella helvata TaxID=349315 RepID=A0ABP4VY95_9ACTN
MSVFDTPRVHFRGTAVTRLPTGPRCGLFDLSTNRALTDDGPVPPDVPPAEYHDYLWRRGPRFGVDGRPDPDGVFSASQGWNFGGNGHFWIDAAVVAVELDDGIDVTDPAVGRAVDMWGHYNEYLATTFNRARVFDVDPSSNWTTTLMVGRFGLGRLGRSQDGGYLMLGDVAGTQPPRWHHRDHRRDVGDHWLAAHLGRAVLHQFAIAAEEGLTWLADADRSPATRRLRDVIEAGGADGVVVQFALSNMAPPTVPNAPDRHDLRGTIAPWRRDEWRSYPAGRLLTPRDGSGPGPGVLSVAVGPDTATFNLATAVPVTLGDGWAPGAEERVDLGDLDLRTARGGRLVASLPRAAYLGKDFDLTSGVVTVPALLPGIEVADEPLCLVAGDTLLVEEETNVQADDAGLIIEYPDVARAEDHAVEVAVRALTRGRPAAVEMIHIRQYANPRSRPLDPAVGDLVEVRPGRLGEPGPFAASCAIGTDDTGVGWFTVRGAGSGATRLHLSARADGRPGGTGAAAYDNDDALGFWAGAGTVHVRVLPDDWALDDADATFDRVYREVFAPYEFLYSFMKDEVFSLADECKVRTYPRLIWQMGDPRNLARTYYMPPTRDLTLPKARLLLAFLRAQQAVADVPVPTRAAPRAGGRIERRGQLWAALRTAASVELAATLQYLFAAYSVPAYGPAEEYVRRGLWTAEQRWLACGDGGETTAGGVRGTLLSIAREEMIHFLMINNIIMAMGEPFHVPAIDFGTLNHTLPIPLDFALEPLGIGSLQRFLALEQPESHIGDLGVGDDPPEGYRSPSALYAEIRAGIERVPDLFMVRKGRGGGEHHLFLRESINAVHPDFQLEVDDVPSALFAIDVITEQGEGGKLASAPSPGGSHFEALLRVSEELLATRSPGRTVWAPAYPVARNPTAHDGRPDRTTVTEPAARALMHLFNRSYYLMLQLMVQHFGYQPDASLRRSKLMNAAIDVMTGMMAPLAEVLVTLPSGQRGLTAGPGFELEDEVVYNSRPDVAMLSVALRFEHLAAAARRCDAAPDRVTDMFAFYADYFRALRI